MPKVVTENQRRGRILKNRKAWIRPYIAGGKVLDLGCIDERHPERIGQSLHAELRQINPNITGVDSDTNAVRVARKHGFEVLLGNAEVGDFGGPFDVILAGELIEHLNNPGKFLDNARKHLQPGGTLLLTTPNPLYLGQQLKVMKYGHPQVHEAHRFWFTPETLEVLLREHEFQLVDFVWFAAKKGIFRRLAGKIRPYWSAGFGMACRY